MVRFVAVAEFESGPLAGLLISRLTEHGFHPVPLDEAAHVQLVGVERVYAVEIPSEERAAVIQFLRENGYGKNLVQ